MPVAASGYGGEMHLDAAFAERLGDQPPGEIVAYAAVHAGGRAVPDGPDRGVRRRPSRLHDHAAVHVAAAREPAGVGADVEHHVADAERDPRGTAYAPAAHAPKAPQNGSSPGCSSGCSRPSTTSTRPSPGSVTRPTTAAGIPASASAVT